MVGIAAPWFRRVELMRSRLVFVKALVAVTLAFMLGVVPLGHVFGQGGRWTVKAPIPTPRSDLAVGVVNGILYAVGGAITHRGEHGVPVYTEYLSTVEAYNPSTNSWSLKAPLPTPRSGVGVGVVDGILYAVGGTGSATGRTEWNEYPLSLNTVDAYDPVTNSWAAKASLPTRRSGYAVGGVAKGMLYVVGGETNIETDLMEAYDPITNRWTGKAPMPSPRKWLGVGVVNDILYAVGGVCCGCCEIEGKVLRTVETYDPTTNTWTAKAPLPAPRAGFAVGVANQILYVVGGYNGSGIALNVVEAYDPIRNVWTTKTSLPVDWFPAGLGVVRGILYAVGGWKRVQIAPEIARDTPGCGWPCYEIVQDPVTYAFRAVP
jgi:N-acetylneuraminic acid mutarotase